MKSVACSEPNNPAPLRLVGLETEYGLRVKPKHSSARPANSEIFQRLLGYVRAKVPIAPSIPAPDQGPYAWFTANGGSVRFERLPVLGAIVAKSGVVEGATPECLNARQLLLYQRAQDALLSQAAAASGGPGCEVALVKNNADAHGAISSSHENYDAEIASGLAFRLWRIGLIAVMIPTAMATECLAAFVLILAAVLYFPAWLADRKTERFVRWWERGTLTLISLLLAPVFLVSNLYFRLLAFRRQRKGLLAFLVSRQVFAGAGRVQPNGDFVLSARAQAIRSLISSASEASRPVFLFGHVLKATSFVVLGDTSRYRSLFQRRQRLQIAIGDSNMAQTAEYLKIGTTQLVLAAIEAGDLKSPPRLRRPLRMLRNFSRDLDLKAKAKLADGRRLTMLEIQREYWEGCRRYVDRVEPGHPESENILALWRKRWMIWNRTRSVSSDAWTGSQNACCSKPAIHYLSRPGESWMPNITSYRAREVTSSLKPPEPPQPSSNQKRFCKQSRNRRREPGLCPWATHSREWSDGILRNGPPYRLVTRSQGTWSKP